MMCRILLFLLCFLPPMVGPATGCETHPAQAVPRTILALYDGRQEKTPADTRLHRFLELPLNHLGYSLSYLDVSDTKLPEPVDPWIAGAVSWFDAPLPDPDRFAAWAAAARSDCPDAFSLIVLGETGLQADRQPLATDALYLRRLGIEWTARSILLGDLTEVTTSASVLPGYETDYVFRPGRYASLRASSPIDSALRVVPSGKKAGDSIDLIVQHHPNAYVHQSATLDADTRAAGQFWIMDPFAILGQALSRNAKSPVADMTTLNGRRIYFETVGPEGWLAPAPARTFDKEPRLGAENLLAKLIEPFPELPVTVAVVTGDLDPAIGGKAAVAGRRAAESIFALPHTQGATSGRSLVRHWAAVSNLTPAGTPAVQEEAAFVDQSNRLLAGLGRNLREAFADTSAPAEPQLSDGLRQYGQDPFEVGAETVDAIKAVRALTPKKPARPLFVWSGDGKPAPHVRAAVANAGSAALGGGLTAIAMTGSISGLSPFFLSDGPNLQVYHALPGDLADLGYPSKEVQALQGLGLLVARTDKPFRLKPFQLAYSAGSANQFATQNVIARLKRAAVSGDSIPILASRYVEIVTGFSSARIKPEGRQKWRITDRGGLQTVRFDNAQAVSLDLAESDGALGARRINGSLYIALDPGVVAPLVALIEDTSHSGMSLLRGQIGLSQSNLEVRSATVTPCQSVLSVTGWGRGEMGIYGDPDARYSISVGTGTGTSGPTQSALDESDIMADASGFATFHIPTLYGEVETITLRQDCAD